MINEKEIKNAIRKVIEWGWQIIPGKYVSVTLQEDGTYKKCCCPMTAYTLHEGYVPIDSWKAQDIADVLDVSLREVEAFVSGFDRTKNLSMFTNNQAYHLGSKIRDWVDGGMKD